MDKKRWIKRVLIGTGIAAAAALSAKGIEYIKSEIAKDNEKNKTEQVIKDMSAQGISVYKKGEKDAPDSVLTSVNKTHDMWTDSEIYSNPKYEKIGSKKPNTVRLGKEETKLVMSPEEQKLKKDIEEKIVSIFKSDSTNEEKRSKIEELLRKMPKEQVKTAQNFEYEEFDRDFKNIEKDGFWSVTSKDAEAKHEQAIYDDGSKKIESEFIVKEMGTGAGIVVRSRTLGGLDNIIETKDYTSDKIAKATANVRRHSETSSKAYNQKGQQLTAKQQRAPKKKSTKRKNRDALPGKTLSQLKSNKKQNG